MQRSGPSLLGLMKLVVFAAATFACLAPMLHLWKAGAVQGGSNAGLGVVAVFEAIVVPLVWTVLAVILVRGEAWRERFILRCLLTSVAVTLGLFCWIFFAFTLPKIRAGGKDVDGSRLGANGAIIVLMTAAAVFLMKRLASRRQRPPSLTAPPERAAASVASSTMDG